MVGSIILSTIYGIKVLPRDDPTVKLIERVSVLFSAGLAAGTRLVDIFPVLRHIPTWLPGAEFKRFAARAREASAAAKETPFLEAKRMMVSYNLLKAA
jgi:hypothetical protein